MRSEPVHPQPPFPRRRPKAQLPQSPEAASYGIHLKASLKASPLRLVYHSGSFTMQRRDLLRLFTSAAALSGMPAELFLALQEARAGTVPYGRLRTLNQHQNATVTTISELIIPETDTPGAKGAKVNEFIDLLLTDWFDQPEKDRFLQGLAQMDADSRKRFGSEFIASNPSQQAELMKQFDSEAMAFARAQKNAAKTDTT